MYSYTFGAYPTIELMQARPDWMIDLLVSESFPRTQPFNSLIPEHISARGGDRAIRSLTKQDNIYVVGVFRKHPAKLNPSQSHMVLVNPEDMGNVGTIMRTMLAYDLYDLAIIRPGVDSFNPKLIRAAMGANFHIRTEYFDSFEHYQDQHANRTYYPFLTNAETSLRALEPVGPYSIIFGSESSGLDPEFEQIGIPVSIPQSSSVDSLNLAVAAGIVLYEFNNG